MDKNGQIQLVSYQKQKQSKALFQYESATSRKSGARVPSCAPRGGTPATLATLATLGSEVFAAVFAGPGLCVAAALMLSSP